MLIENLLIGGIAFSVGYICKTIMGGNEDAINPSIEIDNIVKYEYMPIEYQEFKSLKDKIMFKYVEGEKDGIKAYIGYDKFFKYLYNFSSKNLY